MRKIISCPQGAADAMLRPGSVGWQRGAELQALSPQAGRGKSPVPAEDPRREAGASQGWLKGRG